MIKERNQQLFFQSCDDTIWEFIYLPPREDEELSDIFWNAVDMLDYQDEEAEKVFKKIIAIYPNHIDAYNHLSIAFRNQNKGLESILC